MWRGINVMIYNRSDIYTHSWKDSHDFRSDFTVRNSYRVILAQTIVIFKPLGREIFKGWSTHL